jgi:nicotinamide-nucleotide amidase
MILITGSELLTGAYADGHTHFLTRTLRPLGLQCVGSMCVDDKRADIQEALSFALARAPLVIVTGGLGPTDNDITRQTLADFTRIELREHPEVLGAMARRFGVAADGIRENLRRQTQVPISGTYLKNSTGTAVGLVFELDVFEHDDAAIVALPGPPRELQPMVRDELVPYLSRRFGTRLPGCSLLLRFVGLGQSQISQTLTDHVSLAPDVVISSQFEGSRVDFTFSLPDDTPPDRARLAELKGKILEQLGDSVYAHDDTSLEQCVVNLLADRGATLALAEAGSGGSLAAALAAPDAADRVLAGAFVAPSEEKLRGLLGIPDDQWPADSAAERTRLLAAAAARATASPWAIAVGDAGPDPAGAHHVTVVFKSPDGQLETTQIRLRGTGASAHARLTTQLLDQLRRKLQRQG